MFFFVVFNNFLFNLIIVYLQAAAAFFNEAEDSQTTIGLSVARTRRGETNEEAITRVTAVRAEIRKQVR